MKIKNCIGNDSLVFEAALVKLCMKGNDGSAEALMARIAELEKKIAGGVVQITEKKAVQDVNEESVQDTPVPKKLEIPPSELVNKVKEKYYGF